MAKAKVTTKISVRQRPDETLDDKRKRLLMELAQVDAHLRTLKKEVAFHWVAVQKGGRNATGLLSGARTRIQAYRNKRLTLTRALSVNKRAIKERNRIAAGR